MEKYITTETRERFLSFHCPRFDELPNIPLYKEQLITYIESSLRILNLNKEENLLTPTMLNNYVKQKIVSPPLNKKYTNKHIAYLIVVCILKQVFNFQEIGNLIKKQIKSYPIDIAYDFFCTELEIALQSVFTTRDFSAQSSALKTTYESEIVRSTVMSFSHKIFIQSYLYHE